MQELLKGNIQKTYLKYLATALGSSIIMCVYQLVDTIMVGQYEGPNGTAAMVTLMPIWTIIYSLGLLVGIGGATLMSVARGSGDKKGGDRYFTISLIAVIAVGVISWVAIAVFDHQMLSFFGADDVLMPLALDYLKWIKLVLPLFTFGQFLIIFTRNDDAPGLAAMATIAGGLFNIPGDYFFVFMCDMGMEGAGLATAIGQTLSIAVLCSHFFSKKCKLKIVKPTHFLKGFGAIIKAGLSTFVVDIAMGFLVIMFNNQIMKFEGTEALAVYSVACNISSVLQAFAYGIGQAAQPILSMNYGAKNAKRVMDTLKLSIASVVVLSVIFTVFTMLYPTQLIRLYMDATPKVLAIAPSILHKYFISFIFLPFNIFSAYYFQSILQPKMSLAVSLMRGVIFSGILIYTLPFVFGIDMIWWAMPVAELLTAISVVWLMKRADIKTAMYMR